MVFGCNQLNRTKHDSKESHDEKDGGVGPVSYGPFYWSKMAPLVCYVYLTDTLNWLI